METTSTLSQTLLQAVAAEPEIAEKVQVLVDTMEGMIRSKQDAGKFYHRVSFLGIGLQRKNRRCIIQIGVIINDTQAITFEEAAEVASKRNGSDLDCFTAPNSKRQIVRFGVLSLCRKVAAHFLHTSCTFPEYQVFLRKMRTACFPLHKRKKS